MTKNYSLAVKSRAQEKPANLRRQGKIPAVIYGHGFKNVNLSVTCLEMEKAYQQAGESNLFDLIIDDQQPVKVVIKHVARDPVSGQIIHADFYKVRMDEKITVEVPLEFIGESRAVKDLGGILVKNLDSLEVECLPADLISRLEVDLSKLHALGDMIRVGDLQTPGNINIRHDAEDVVVLAEEPKKSEEKPSPQEQPKDKQEKGAHTEDAAQSDKAGSGKQDKGDKKESDKNT